MKQAQPRVHLRKEATPTAVRRTFRGAHTGSSMGIPPTGRQVTITDMAILRVANGEFVEARKVIPTFPHGQVSDRPLRVSPSWVWGRNPSNAASPALQRSGV